VVLELDGQPAFNAYQKHARAQKVTLDEENTSRFLLTNELGVLLFENLYKVRAPRAVTPQGGLVCAGAVESGASVTIVTAEAEAMKDAVKTASLEARKNLQGASAAGVLVFSCVCRGLVLGDAFQAEIDTIREVFPGVPLGGMLSYGEIARYSGRLNGYHNNTVVIAAIPA
jgi:hypothetical protein